MKTKKTFTTTGPDGARVRGFMVLIKAPGQKRVLSLPCSGCALYTGEQAREIMENYAKDRPAVQTCAHTETNGDAEQLTLSEMRELYS